MPWFTRKAGPVPMNLGNKNFETDKLAVWDYNHESDNPRGHHLRRNHALEPYARLEANVTKDDFHMWKLTMTNVFREAGVYPVMKDVIEGTATLVDGTHAAAGGGAQVAEQETYATTTAGEERRPARPNLSTPPRLPLPRRETRLHRDLAVAMALIERAINPLWYRCIRNDMEIRHPHDMSEALERWCIDQVPGDKPDAEEEDGWCVKGYPKRWW